MQVPDQLRPDRAQTIVGACMLACYAIGYPVALGLRSPIGWLFVLVGGFFLFGLVGLTVRRIHRSTLPAAGPEMDPGEG